MCTRCQDSPLGHERQEALREAERAVRRTGVEPGAVAGFLYQISIYPVHHGEAVDMDAARRVTAAWRLPGEKTSETDHVMVDVLHIGDAVAAIKTFGYSVDAESEASEDDETAWGEE